MSVLAKELKAGMRLAGGSLVTKAEKADDTVYVTVRKSGSNVTLTPYFKHDPVDVMSAVDAAASGNLAGFVKGAS